MANVLFKRGLHSALPAANAATDGVFYLTTDTNRLYVGQGTNLVELNKSITVVDTIANLPAVANVEVGQFYYVKGPNAGADNVQNGNILAVCVSDGTTKRWVQVNPDTNTDTGYNYISSTASVSGDGDGVVDPENHRIEYTITLTQMHKDGNASSGASEGDVTATFYVNSDDINSIVQDVEVSFGATAVSTATVAGGSTTLNVGGSNATGAGVVVNAGQNVTLTGGGNAPLVINAVDTKYDLESAANSKSIVLKEGNQSKATVNFAAGTALEVSEATAGTISYNHADVAASTSGGDATKQSTATAQNASNNATIDVVESVVVNAQGHVTNVATKTITAKDTYPTGGSITVNGEAISGSVALNNSSSVTLTGSDSALYHNLTINGVTTKVSNQGTLTTNLYSADEIDSKIRGLNAMTYKGTVGTNGTVSALPTSQVQLGDTYMVKTAGVGPESGSKPGDLYIAVGTEDSSGYITSSTLSWEHVAAGADKDTTYTFSVASDGTISYVTSTDQNTNVTLAKVTADRDLTSDVSGSTITIKHATGLVTAGTKGDNSSATSPIAYGGSFVVPTVTVNAQGHVTGLTEETITLPASIDSKYALSTDANDSPANSAKVVLTASGSSSGTTNAIVSSDGVVTVSGSSSGISIGHANKFSGTAGAFGPAADVSKSNTDASASFVVPQITVDAQGHVTAVSERSISLADKDTTYAWTAANITTAAATNGVSGTISLTPTVGGTAAAAITTSFSAVSAGQSVKITPAANGAINFEIEWGTF